MIYKNSLAFAKNLDQKDPLKKFRNNFIFPQHEGAKALYFTGNSLGLQPKSVEKSIHQELKDWGEFGVEGHFQAKNPWFSYHETLTKSLAKLTGSEPTEVVAMNQLTSNLHFLFVSFYRPTKKRFKIICEAKAFPSDQYLIETQVKFHGFNPKRAIVEVAPRPGEYESRHEDILKCIEDNKDEVALVFFGGVNYFSGQVFDMQAITAAGHAAGAMVGFDLAHAVGNIELALHDWDVDFAAWCTYKYLNSGPGSVGGAFVHKRHHNDSTLPRFAGWWGYNKGKRFKMEQGFEPISSAEGWQVSNAPVLSMTAHKAALESFDQAGMKSLVKKSQQMTGYLRYIIEEVGAGKLEIITPKKGRVKMGCQLSIIAHGHGKPLFEALTKNGVIADWREPNVIRVAPVPLYNSYEDCYRLGQVLKRILFFLAIVCNFFFAETVNASTVINLSDSVEQVDIRDIAKFHFTRKHKIEEPILDTCGEPTTVTEISHPILKDNEIKPGKLYFAAIPAIGLTIQTGVTAIIAMNGSFYTGKLDNTNISTITFNPAMSLNYNQYLFPVEMNIWTPKNGINVLVDWRYYIYPTYTYGTGGNSDLYNANLVNYSYLRFYEVVLKSLGKNYYVGAGLNYDAHLNQKVVETIGNGTDFQAYNQDAKNTVSSGASLVGIYDSRKNSNNPTENSTYLSFSYRSNLKIMGSNTNYQAAQFEARKYIKLTPSGSQMLALWNINWYTFGGKAPYFDLPSTGWDTYSNTGRGYIQGRLRGSAMEYLEAEYRFRITKNGLLGGVLFTNVESVADVNTYHFGSVLPGYGFGIRIKANKKSNVNFAIDYGFGTQQSQGFAFNVAEIF